MEGKRDELIGDVTQSLFEIGRRINQFFFQKEFHLTPVQFFILHHLLQHERMTVSRLGELLGLTSGATTIAINRLEESQLIERTRDMNDRRVVWLQLTEQGEELIQSSLQKRNQIALEVFEHFSTEEISQLQEMLVKVRENAK